MAELYGRVAEQYGGRPPRAELHDVIGNDDHVVALHSIRLVRAGKELQADAVLVFHVRDGKITEAWDVLIDQDAAAEFWS